MASPPPPLPPLLPPLAAGAAAPAPFCLRNMASLEVHALLTMRVVVLAAAALASARLGAPPPPPPAGTAADRVLTADSPFCLPDESPPAGGLALRLRRAVGEDALASAAEDPG